MTRTLLILAALLYLVMIVLGLRPVTDIEIERLFFVPPHGFVFATPAGTAARYAAWALPFVLLAVLTIAWGLRRAGVLAPRLAPCGRALLLLVLVMAVGPGLIVHAGLKEVSHRPRPGQAMSFGGTESFRPFYRFDGACRHNCAFPSGETAAAAWTLAPAMLVPPPWRAAAMAAALVFTAATAVGRLAIGAHWLSDVVGAALIVVLVILAARAVPWFRSGDDRA